MQIIEEIINRGNPNELRELFSFDDTNSNESVIFKFNLWTRYFFLKYLSSKDCIEHEKMDLNNIKAYRGQINQYVNIAFRGFSKTARTKLFLAFCISNDLQHTKRFIRAISADLDNAKQSVTDIYNMFVQPEMKRVYPEIFAKTDIMREETMNGFTTSTGIKVIAKQIGVEQRGKIMEDAKSDLDWYDDIETKTTIRSAVITHKIWENMEEARTGLALKGASIYTANYFSEMGNIHKLVTDKLSDRKVVQIVPIIRNPVFETKEDGKRHIVGGDIVWDRYTIDDIDVFYQDDDDFNGERLCKPDASKDIYFDREKLDNMPVKQPIDIIAGFKMFAKYNPSHRYGSGHDVAGGVGLDSSASVFIDFDTIPAQVVGTYHSNEILPEAFGDEIYSEGKRFGLPVQGVENNKFDQAILKARQLGANLFMQPNNPIKSGYKPPTIYGWNTNSLTKSKMLSDFRQAIEDGLISLNDEELIQEAKSFTRNDLIDNPPDIRLATRHFDLLISACIAWQMKDHSRPNRSGNEYESLSNRDETPENPAV